MPLVLAKIPRASQIVSIKGEKIMFQQGRQRRTQAQVGQRLENKNQKLIVSGNSNDLARLIFLRENDFYSGLLLQAGPDSQETQYQFPCTLENGTLTIGWRQGKNRGCEEGIYLSPTDNNKNQTKQNIIAQSPKNRERTVVIKPNQPEAILFQVYSGDEQQEIKALIGNLFVKTAQHPNGFILTERQQWSYDDQTNQETIEPMETKPILNSPQMQEFLQAKYWFSQSFSVIDNYLIIGQINDLERIALNTPTPTQIPQPESPQVNIFCQQKVNLYLRDLKSTLNDTWSPPKPPNKGVWRALLTYNITKNGQVQNIQVVETSGYQPLDKAAMNHIYSLEQNFSPFPSCYTRDTLPVDHTFKLLYY